MKKKKGTLQICHSLIQPLCCHRPLAIVLNFVSLGTKMGALCIFSLLIAFWWQCYALKGPMLPLKVTRPIERHASCLKPLQVTTATPGTNGDKIRIQESVLNLMPQNFPKALSTDTVYDAVERMNEARRGSVLVVDNYDSNKFVGIFTERDFVRKVFESNRDATATTLSEVMTTAENCDVIPPSASIAASREIMLKLNRRRMPVINDSNEAVGVISLSDIITSLAAEDKQKLIRTSVTDAVADAKSRANQLALANDSELAKQDIFRSIFVVAASVVGAGVAQGEWIRQHEYLAMIYTFGLGYVGIILETLFEFNKAAIALLMSAALWVIFGSASGASPAVLASLGEHVGEVSEIVYFLLGAMTIVEIVDAHQGFKVVTDVIEAKDKRQLMWVLGLLTFFMSAILDNLTTTIVMVSLIKKILPDQEDRKLFGAMTVIAANAGGAWTPIGDVTTTMLWINGQISAMPTMTGLFLPSIVSTILSLSFLSRQIPEGEKVEESLGTTTELAPRGKLVFATGIAGLLSVPVFKSVTGLPPYLGMLAALGVMWTLTDAIHAGEGKEGREELMAPAALRKIDTSGVLFFLGILLSVGALDAAGILKDLATILDRNIDSEPAIATAIGVASSVIDNVPLVAATMGMYNLDQQPLDAQLWQLIAFCAGTGGSLLVIGSAAGVALMGLEKVEFLWYAKRISLSALVGYLGGIGVYLGQSQLSHLF